MGEMDEDILKLNQRITGLLTENVNLAEVNQRLKRDFDRLKGEIDEHRRSAIESCELSDRYKFDLEKEIQIREAIFEAHQKQKSKFLSLNEENYLLKERIKSLENALERRRSSQPFGNSNSSRFSIMDTLRSFNITEGSSNRASMSHSPVRRSTGVNRKTQEIERQRVKIEELNKELSESYELISCLEFELDSIVYYEHEIQNLQSKIAELTERKEINTNPFISDSEDNEDDDSSETTYEQLVNEEKALKRIELQNKLKRFHEKQEAATSPTPTSISELPDLHEQLKSI